MKSEESDERPDFEEDDELEFDWEARKLHFFMKNLLATDRFLFIFCFGLAAIPAAIHKIETRQSYLNYDEGN